MAVKTYMVASGADGNFGALVDGVNQTAASRTDGWTVGKLAAANMADFDAGTKLTTAAFSTFAGPNPLATGTTANAFKTPAALSGIFAATAWTFTFAVRAGTASSQAGRMRLRVFAATNAAGTTGVRELTGATQIGTTSAGITTSADATSTVTWSPGVITLSNEFLFFVISWEVTTASGSNSGDVVIRTGQSAAGSRLVTPDLALPTPKSGTDANSTTTEFGDTPRLGDADLSPFVAEIASVRVFSTDVDALSLPPETQALLANPSANDVNGATSEIASAVISVTPVSSSDTGGTAGAGASFSDDFTRANGALGSNWVDQSDSLVTGVVAIDTNQIKSTNTEAGATWVGNTFPDDQFSEIQITTLPPSGSWIGVTVRYQPVSKNFYVLIYYNDGSVNHLMVYRNIGGSYLNILDMAQTLSVNDTIRLGVVGNTLTTYVNGSPVHVDSDSNIPSGGSPGVRFFGVNARGDNWQGGGVGGTSGETATVDQSIAISGTDTNGATTETQTITAPVAATDSSGVITEAVSVKVVTSDVDALSLPPETQALLARPISTDANGTTTEAQAVVTLTQISGSDTNGATTETAAFTFALSGVDTGSDSEIAAAPRVILVTTDAATAVEVVTTNTPIASADSGTISEVVSTRAIVTSDTASAADIGSTASVQAVSASDTGLGASESASVAAKVSGGDSGGVTAESASVGFLLAATDSGTISETTQQVVKLTAADSGISTDTAATKVVLTTADVGLASDTTRPLRLYATDTVVGYEIVSLGTLLVDVDMGLTFEISQVVIAGAIAADAAKSILAVNGVDSGILTGSGISETSLTSTGSPGGLVSVGNGGTSQISDINHPDRGVLTGVK